MCSSDLAIGCALVIRAVSGNMVGAAIAAFVVLSHWLLDWVVHIPDLTIAGSPPKLGLGLWNTPAVAMPFELAVLGGSAWLYAHHTRAISKRWLLPALICLLLVLQAINWFDPPPEAVDAGLWGGALIAYAMAAAMAWWVARNRVPR